MSIARDISRQTSRQTVTLTANQTAVTVTGGFSGSSLETYLNGVRLIQGSDYSLNGTSGITLTQGASAGDIIEFSIRNTSNSGLSAVNTSEIVDEAVTFDKLSDSSTTAENVQQRVAKAWCYFGGGTYGSVDPFIVRSFNVSSVTDSGFSYRGQYKLSFENNMESASYVVVTSAAITAAGHIASVWPNSKSTSSVDIYGLVNYGTIAYADMGGMDIAIFE